MIKKYNITVPEKYTKNGVEKTKWYDVGEMIEFIKEDGSTSRQIKIPTISLVAQVFPVQDKTEARPPQPQTKSEISANKEWEKYGTQKEVEEEPINAEDLPF